VVVNLKGAIETQFGRTVDGSEAAPGTLDIGLRRVPESVTSSISCSMKVKFAVHCPENRAEAPLAEFVAFHIPLV
jgi:hypothetical protein